MPVSSDLRQLNLISGMKVPDIFDLLYSDILSISYKSESELIDELWSRYEQYEKKQPSLNGAVFEGILATILYRSDIVPLYVQAKLSFVPNVDFDFVAYTKEFGPIILSAKTSLRERYKQADLEGMMLRQVHRNAKSYLITLNSKEAESVNKKIANGLVLGLDDVIVANHIRFDDLISKLKSYTYFQPKKIDVLTSTRLISHITKQ